MLLVMKYFTYFHQHQFVSKLLIPLQIDVHSVTSSKIGKNIIIDMWVLFYGYISSNLSMVNSLIVPQTCVGVTIPSLWDKRIFIVVVANFQFICDFMYHIF